jgi:hypothetical protein
MCLAEDGSLVDWWQEHTDSYTACMLGISVEIRLGMGLEVQPSMVQRSLLTTYARRYVCCR